MFDFETMIIMPPNLSDKTYLSVFSDIENFIKLQGGAVNKIERWGNKYLAYELNGSIYGYYALITFEYPLQDVSDIYKYLHSHEKILRNMIISKEDR